MGSRNGRNSGTSFVPEYEELRPTAVEWAPQTIGPIRRQTKTFQKKRQRVAEHNDVNAAQLVSRVEKLLYSGPSTRLVGKAAQKARRSFEQDVVPWVKASDVPACPDCGNNFGFFRRRHHCRLCGSVLCMECSRSLDVDVAITLIKVPVLAGKRAGVAGVGGDGGDSGGSDIASHTPTRKVRMQEDHMRICGFCEDTIIKSREKKKKKAPPVAGQAAAVVKLYARLREDMAWVEENLPKYNTIVLRMHNAKTIEGYESAADRRGPLTKRFETIDAVSKKIHTLAASEQQDPRSSSQKLQKAIFAVAREFLQMNMLLMQGLPPRETLQKQFREHQAKLQAARDAKRRAREEAMARRQREQEEAARRARDAEEAIAARARARAEQQQMEKVSPRRQSRLGGGRRKSSMNALVNGGGGGGGGDGGGGGGNMSGRDSTSVLPSMASASGGGADLDQLLQEQRDALHSHLRTAQREGRLDEVRMIQAQLEQMADFQAHDAAAAKPLPSQTPSARKRSQTFADVLQEQRTVLQRQLKKALDEGREDDAAAIRASATELEAFAASGAGN